jgi:hypothetical protein
VADPSDRDRVIAAYAAEVRAFQALLAAVLVVLALLHLLVLLPIHQARGAAGWLVAAVAAVEHEQETIAAAARAVEEATAGLRRFRRDLAAAPAQLHRAVANLIERGLASAGSGGDPYKATITVESPQGQIVAETVEEAIRRQIGQLVEALGLAADGTLEPLRALGEGPPEIKEAVRIAQDSLGPAVLALNGVLRDALAADPTFWVRVDGPTGFGPASPGAAAWSRSMEETVRGLDARLSEAQTGLVARARAAAARAERLRERQREAEADRAALAARLAWLPMSPEGWLRLYPMIAGALALTVLFRLRRVLLLRGALAGADVDALAPSWVVGPPAAPGRWWALVLVALPVAATAHGVTVALGDGALFADAAGGPDLPAAAAYGAAYAVLVLAALWQLLLAARELVGRPPGRRTVPIARPGAR